MYGPCQLIAHTLSRKYQSALYYNNFMSSNSLQVRTIFKGVSFPIIFILYQASDPKAREWLLATNVFLTDPTNAPRTLKAGMHTTTTTKPAVMEMMVMLVAVHWVSLWLVRFY